MDRTQKIALDILNKNGYTIKEHKDFYEAQKNGKKFYSSTIVVLLVVSK